MSALAAVDVEVAAAAVVDVAVVAGVDAAERIDAMVAARGHDAKALWDVLSMVDEPVVPAED